MIDTLLLTTPAKPAVKAPAFTLFRFSEIPRRNLFKAKALGTDTALRRKSAKTVGNKSKGKSAVGCPYKLSRPLKDYNIFVRVPDYT